MRVAILSDIHGNRTAFEAVLTDLRQTSPDLVLHGGDLADAGSSPVEIVDRIRDLGWPGVVGNTDEMLSMPATFENFAASRPHLQSIWIAAREMAIFTRQALGEERLAWLRGLPTIHVQSPMALVHASPNNRWSSPMPGATDSELESVYGVLGQAVTVYGHIHLPYVRRLSAMIVANTGSVGLPYDGDRRASYLLLDESKAEIRRVEYAVEREIEALSVSGLPYANWVGKNSR